MFEPHVMNDVATCVGAFHTASIIFETSRKTSNAKLKAGRFG
jgi:hypothetical protein